MLFKDKKISQALFCEHLVPFLSRDILQTMLYKSNAPWQGHHGRTDPFPTFMLLHISCMSLARFPEGGFLSSVSQTWPIISVTEVTC